MWYNGEADVNKKEIRELQQLAVVKKQNHEVEPVWMSEETRSTQVFWDLSSVNNIMLASISLKG